ncbi:carbohydrate ABC transporter permease [Streptomyces chromofuscus]|uniref:Sugar ABC transporter permease n=1 Tax=Streptomyces chromofuscus TaxID=42881 RepID=A0A7M2TDG5_STRCW|nr:sugar ABC transporter permease [Streptomyces chromofuscus]QOV45768.1 sugar ABC transporter permease [Streptomyces chromofuscus]GGT17723.1 sugar ABC transporter permease [Streptomyces chromofuscus]
MTLAPSSDQLTVDASRGRRSRRGGGKPAGRASARSPIGYVFVSPYALLTIAFGIVPSLYAVLLAFTNADGGFAGFDNFTKVIDDFRFWPAVFHVTIYLVIWLLGLVVFVVGLALMVHAIGVRWVSTTLRFVYYLPGALAGASSILLWLFVLDPTASPVSGLLSAMGFDSFVQVIQPGNLPAIFAIIAFWTGAGGWIIIMYGALNNISTEVIEAARIDGANAVQIALRIQLPMLRKWVAYMGVMSLAAGTQLFVEPQLLSQASNAVVPNDYSLNQLAYQYAFQQNDFNGAAAISLILLVVALLLSWVFVTRGGLFEKE